MAWCIKPRVQPLVLTEQTKQKSSLWSHQTSILDTIPGSSFWVSFCVFCATGESWQWPVDTDPKQPTGFLRAALKEAQFPTGNAIMQAAIKEPFLNLSFQRNQEFQLLAVMVGPQYTCLEPPNKTLFHYLYLSSLYKNGGSISYSVFTSHFNASHEVRSQT